MTDEWDKKDESNEGFQIKTMGNETFENKIINNSCEKIIKKKKKKFIIFNSKFYVIESAEKSHKSILRKSSISVEI